MPEGPAAGFLFFAMMYEMVQVRDAFEAEFIHARIPFDSVRRPPQYEKLATSSFTDEADHRATNVTIFFV
jgi:hypothetical protein